MGGAPAAPANLGDPENSLALNRSGAGGDDLDEIEADMLGDWQELADDLQGAIATVMDGAPAMRTCSSACWAAAPSSWPGWSPS